MGLFRFSPFKAPNRLFVQMHIQRFSLPNNWFQHKRVLIRLRILQQPYWVFVFSLLSLIYCQPTHQKFDLHKLHKPVQTNFSPLRKKFGKSSQKRQEHLLLLCSKILWSTWIFLSQQYPINAFLRSSLLFGYFWKNIRHQWFTRCFHKTIGWWIDRPENSYLQQKTQ